MNEKNNLEIEELLNAYVDGEASQRQQTELKRLMLHDPSINDRINLLQRQKQLLNALPVESAPEGLAEEIRSVMERRLILDNFAAPVQHAGSGRMRRVLTAAAMIFLPVGLLGVIVFEIMKPPAVEPARGVISNAGNTVVDDIAAMPFNGILTFETDQLAGMSSYIEKKMFDQGFNTQKASTSNNNSISYEINMPREKVLALIDSMKDAWTRSDSVWLSVAVNTDAGKIDIPDVKPEQLKTLAVEDDGPAFSRLAAAYASANQDSGQFFAKQNPGSELGPDGFPPLDQPIMTGRYKPAQPDDSDQPVIRLRIVLLKTQQ